MDAASTGSRKRSRTSSLSTGGVGQLGVGSSSARGGGSGSSHLQSMTTTTAANTTTAASTSFGGFQFFHAVPRPESSDDRVRASQLRDPKQRIKALNAILKLSSSHEMNYALTGDSVLQSLLQIAMESMQWDKSLPPTKKPSSQGINNATSHRNNNNNATANNDSSCINGNDKNDGDDEDEFDEEPVFSSSTAWIRCPTTEMERWALHWKNCLGNARRCIHSNPQDANNNFKILEVIVAILRNLSFVGANLRMLAYTPAVVAVLIGCMYEGHDDYGSAAAASDHRGGGVVGSGGREGVGTGTGGGNTSSSTSASEEASKVALSRINLTVNAMQTLIHLIPHLDVSGQKILADKLFYSPYSNKEGPMVPGSSAFGQTAGGNWGFGGMWLAKRLDAKEDVMSDVTKELLLAFVSDSLVAVWSIFPALAHVLTNPRCPRAVMLVAVDLLQELINQARVGVVGIVDWHDKTDELPTLRAVLVRMPNAVVERLVDLLYIPRLGPDSLEYLDPVHNIVTRVTTLKLLMGYDATVDTDLRDRTLDVLVPLLELDSPHMAARLGMHRLLGDDVAGSRDATTTNTNNSNLPPMVVRSRLWDALVPILTTKVGRNEATVLASQLFRELAKADSNRPALQYVQGRLVELASRDNRVAHLVWNYLYPIQVDDDREVANHDHSSAMDTSATLGNDGGEDGNN